MIKQSSRRPSLRHPLSAKACLAGLGLAAFALLAPSSGAAQGTTFMLLEPRETTVEPGSEIALQVQIRDAEDLAAYQFTLNFPPTLLDYVSIEPGDFLGGTGRTVTAFPPVVENGRVTFVAISSNDGPGVTGDGTLATLRFRSTGELGQATINLDEALVTDATNENRQRVETEDGRVTIEDPRFYVYAPFTVKNLSKAQIPPPLVSNPPEATPTRVRPTDPPAEPTATPEPGITPEPSPTPGGKPWPEIGEMQCFGRTEWVTIKNGTGAEVDLEGWSIRSTQGGETYWVENLVLAPGEELFIYSGPGSPRQEERLKRTWDTFQRWNDAGDSAELYSPRPERVIRDDMDCPPPAE